MKKLILIAILFATSAFAGVYEGRIDGEYHGWDGDTIYQLADGHIIKQDDYHLHLALRLSPRVIIYRSSGGLMIHVVDDNDQDVRIEILR
jgi:hypothetical protein